MKTLNINGHNIELELVDSLEGYYLRNMTDWNEDVVKALASQDGLTLGEMHWCIVNEFRKYHVEFQCYPSKNVLKDRMLYNCQINHEEFLKLFPKGHYQATRISGIPLPTGFGNPLGL